MTLDAHELQALLRYHCASIVDVIDEGGLKPSKLEIAEQTGKRILQIIVMLKASSPQT